MTTPGPWSEARARCDAMGRADDNGFGWTINEKRALLNDFGAALDAIDAVLALHQREPDGTCSECDDGNYSHLPVSYPCPTVRALGVTE